MTMSLTLVNTSNWDNENYEVTDKYGNSVTIKPGESIVLYPDEAMPEIRAVPLKKDEKPFEMNGKQMMPRVYIGFE